MSDDIFIKHGSNFQQPYIARTPTSAQEYTVAQRTYQVATPGTQPFTYDNRSPINVQTVTNVQNVTTAQGNDQATYQHRSPFTYNHRSPLTYDHRSPLTYNHRSPSTYQHRSPLIYQITYQNREPSTYQHRSPLIYRTPTQTRTPSTYQHRSPLTYNHRSPFTYDHRSPFTYDHRSPSRTPSTYQHRQPLTYDHRSPFRSPFTYQHRSPSTYQHRTPSTYPRDAQIVYTYQATGQEPNIRDKQEPNIRNIQQPNIRDKQQSAQQPVIRDKQEPNIRNKQQSAQEPVIRNKQQPVIRDKQSPYIANKASPYIASAQNTVTSQRVITFSQLQHATISGTAGPWRTLYHHNENEAGENNFTFVFINVVRSGNDIIIYGVHHYTSGQASYEESKIYTGLNSTGTVKTIGNGTATTFAHKFEIARVVDAFNVATWTAKYAVTNQYGLNEGSFTAVNFGTSATTIPTTDISGSGAMYLRLRADSALEGDSHERRDRVTITFEASGQTSIVMPTIDMIASNEQQEGDEEEDECNQCCVHESMLIAVEEDMKSIHEIKIGDSVISHNFETGEDELVEVEDLIIVERDVDYKVNNLILTEDHPIYLQDGSKVSVNPDATLLNYKQEVEKVKVGDVMIKLDGTKEEITSIERYEGMHKNYAIKTKHNNFYADGVLVDSVLQRGKE